MSVANSPAGPLISHFRSNAKLVEEWRKAAGGACCGFCWLTQKPGGWGTSTGAAECYPPGSWRLGIAQAEGSGLANQSDSYSALSVYSGSQSTRVGVIRYLNRSPSCLFQLQMTSCKQNDLVPQQPHANPPTQSSPRVLPHKWTLPKNQWHGSVAPDHSAHPF